MPVTPSEFILSWTPTPDGYHGSHDQRQRAARQAPGDRRAGAARQQVDGSSRVRVEGTDAPRAERARNLFFRYRDKDYSFTDCTSFVVMRDLRLQAALTLDHHFAQMGFQLLPGPL